MAQKLSSFMQQPVGPRKLSDFGGPLRKRLVDIDPERDIKPIRFGKQLTNVFSRSVKEAFYGVGGGKILSYLAANRLNKRLKEKGVTPPSLRETQKRVKAAIMGELGEKVPEFKVTPAITVGEKATDIAAGITGFVTELAVLKKATGLKGAKLWEVQNLASGGTPGVGAATYGIFNLPGKVIKGASIAAKGGRLASESVLLGGMSAAQQKIQTGEIDATEVLISAGIPVGLRAVGGAKGVLSRSLKAKNVKVVKAMNEALSQEAAIAPEMEVANQALRTWAPAAKEIAKKVKEPAIHALRKRQAQRGTTLLQRSLGKGGSAYQAIKKSVFGYKDKANVPDITPPPLTETQWEGYAKRILHMFPETSIKGQFDRTNTMKALDQLRKGKIPTNRQFELLEPLFGPKTTEELFKELVKKRQFSGWDVPALTVQGLKSIFGLDLQISRQAGTLKWRHPILYKKAQWANIRGYVNKTYADNAMTKLIQSPGYAESAKQLNYIGSKGYSAKRLEYFRMGFTELLANTKFKNTIINKTLGTPLRAYGKFLQASERGATVGINQMMKALWDKGMRDLSQIPNLTVAQREAWIANRAKTINTNMKILRSKNPKVQQLQNAANYILFSPSVTASKPLTIKALIANKGSRGYQAQVLASNIGGIMATTAIPAIIAQHQLRQKPNEEPTISGELNPLSSSWGKIRVSNEVFDFSGGDAPFYRTLARIGVSAYLYGQEKVTGERQTTVAGKRVPSISETLTRYGESRETALLGLAKTLATGKDFVGNDMPGYEALLKAISPEIVTATVEAGLADGTWAALATGVATANSVGVSTYPIPAANTRSNFRNIIAQRAYGKRWDDIGLKEQRQLLIQNRKQFAAFDKLIKAERVEKPFTPERIIEEEKKSGKRITKMLSKTNRAKVAGVSVSVSRRPKNFYLNDKRYQEYQRLTAKYLNERLTKLNLENKSDKVRTKLLEVSVKLAKDKAFRDIRKEMR